MAPSIEAFVQDVRVALRGLRRTPAFTVVAIITLAIGIGLNAAVFTVTNAVLFKGFRSIADNDRILYIGTQKNGRGAGVSYPDLVDWRAQVRSFGGLGAVADLRVALSDSNGTESYIATEVTANTFQLLGATPILGRDFAFSDEQPGAPLVVMLSHRLWTRRFAGDPTVLGRVVRVNGTPATVIGVMDSGFAFPQNQDLWLPLAPTPVRQQRANRSMWFAFGRLNAEATFESARAELLSIGGRLAMAYPDTNEDLVPYPRTFAEFFIGRTAPATYRALWGAVGFVLLIACANLTNLTLARTAERTREFGVRLALGSGRWRLVRQLLIESVMLSAGAGAIGWWIADGAVRIYALWANPPGRLWSDNLIDYAIDGRVLGYLATLSIVTGLVFGLVPALRLSAFDVNATLNDAGARGATGGRRAARLSGGLIVAEMALAVVLLAGAGVMGRSLSSIASVDVGAETSETLTMLVNLPKTTYAAADAQVAFFDRLLAQLQSVAGLESATLATVLPTAGTQTLTYEPADAAGERTHPTVSAIAIAPDYFRSLGVAVRAGRDFAAADDATAQPVVIVNDAFAEREWPSDDPLGKRIWFDRGRADGSAIVVGVVRNILQNDPSRSGQRFGPVIYLPYRQRPSNTVWVLARTRVTPASLAPAFRREVQSIDPDLPVWLGPLPVEQVLAGYGSVWMTGTVAALFLTFALVATVLAAIGLYGVIAHALSQRTREIGVRIAVGATTRDVLALVLTRGLRHAAMGLAIGLVSAPALTRLLSGFLVGVSPTDPFTLAAAAIVLVLTAVCGCLVPARRAMRLDPVVALRRE